MKFIDTHTHAWGPDSDELPWTEALVPPGWDGAYTHDQLIADMDAIGVNEAVVVTMPMYGRGPRANEYTMRSIEVHPDRLYGVGMMELFPEDGPGVRERARQVLGHDRMIGIRLYAPFTYEETPTELDREADWFLNPSLDPIFEEAARSDDAVFVFPKAQQLSMVKQVVSRHPDTDIVIDHMAWPDETTDPHEPPWTDFEAIAEHENVYVKVSSVPRSAEESWPYRDMFGYVEQLLTWFGPERLMLGSDYPWMDSWAAYEECLSWIYEAEFCSARDVAYLSHRTFERVHR